MKALITGGAGFIGSHLVDLLLSERIQVTVLDVVPQADAWRLKRSACAYHCGDIRDLGAVRTAASGCDVVFHLAALLGTDDLVTAAYDAVTTNILGTLNVLTVARENSALLVHTSLIPDWSNSYMITKQAASKFCRMYCRELSTNVVDLRLTHVYGPGQLWCPLRRVIPSFLRAALLGLPIEIYGDGSQLLDLLNVRDAVRAIRTAAATHSAVGQSIEVGTGKAESLVDVAKMIIKQVNSTSCLRFVGRRTGESEDPREFRAVDTRQQTSLLQFESQITFSDGLAEAAYWIERRLRESEYARADAGRDAGQVRA
jgi:nucleoside-diphosphate-sugar epimerase